MQILHVFIFLFVICLIFGMLLIQILFCTEQMRIHYALNNRFMKLKGGVIFFFFFGNRSELG